MRRCVCTVSPPSTRVSRCFPLDTVSVTVRPVRSVVANRGTRKSLRVSTRPASASSSSRAVRQTASPSGMRPASHRRMAGAQRARAAGHQGRHMLTRGDRGRQTSFLRRSRSSTLPWTFRRPVSQARAKLPGSSLMDTTTSLFAVNRT